jgi:FtsH-binding integral membrane protein
MSHFILDFIVHVPELPVLGPDSYKLGLGLWDHMSIALVLEMLLAVIGLILYFSTPGEEGSRARFGILILIVAFSVLTVVGMTSSVPPNLTVLAVSWIVMPLILSGIAFWVDRKRIS